MLDWKPFFLAYLRSRSRLFIYLLSLAFLVLLFQFLFTSLGTYFLYFLLLCCFVTILFFTWDILVEMQVYRQELLYGEREAQSPLEIALAEKLEAREMALYQQRSDAERKLTDLLDYYTLWVHQIKTPIAASQLLVAEVADRQLKQQLEQEIFKIDSYTNLVLQYLRLESFHDDLVLKQVQIEDLVKEIIRKYALFFIQKGLNVNLHDLDKGIGIKNSDVLRVFERGFSGYNGRLTQQSSGLGLYLSKKISEELGHQICIESEVGKGTIVRIRFAQVNLVLE